jgi:hypothetical protein
VQAITVSDACWPQRNLRNRCMLSFNASAHSLTATFDGRCNSLVAFVQLSRVVVINKTLNGLVHMTRKNLWQEPWLLPCAKVPVMGVGAWSWGDRSG